MLRRISDPIKFNDGCIFSILESIGSNEAKAHHAHEKKSNDVDASSFKRTARISGPLGSIDLQVPEYLKCSFADGVLAMSLSKQKNSLAKDLRARLGTFKALVLSSMIGTTKFHSKIVVITGTGSKAEVNEKILTLRIGKSHPVLVNIPNDLSCVVESSTIEQTRLSIKGIDICQVGKFSRELCDLVRNPYKKGIHIYPGDRQLITREGKKQK